MDFSSWRDVFEALAKTGLLALFVALAGWFFVYKNSRSLQKRSETWAIVKNISDLLKEIETCSRKFWLPSDDKFLNAMSYQMEVSACISEVERWMALFESRISKKNMLSEDCANVITQIFREATFNIESVATTDKMQRMRVVSLLSKHSTRIKHYIDTGFTRQFF
ncbi:hypothetical protein RVW00_004293 [Enterobacter bugandensis]|nr:hypothetical protein [Enterobacter bugandensis]